MVEPRACVGYLVFVEGSRGHFWFVHLFDFLLSLETIEGLQSSLFCCNLIGFCRGEKYRFFFYPKHSHLFLLLLFDFLLVVHIFLLTGLFPRLFLFDFLFFDLGQSSSSLVLLVFLLKLVDKFDEDPDLVPGGLVDLIAFVEGELENAVLYF